MRAWMTNVAIIAGLLGFTSIKPALGAGAKPTHYFISVDGLQPAHLETMAADQILQAPRGLGWLYGASALSMQTSTIVTTLTAPSHVSTITCSEPADHGIIANSFLRDGEKTNGFMTPFATEPFWRAAMRQGQKVLVLAYVGADGQTTARTATAGLAYPDYSRLGAGAKYDWQMSEQPAAQGWAGRVIHADSREATMQITLNPKTKEKRQLYALLEPRPDGLIDVTLDDDKRLDNGTLGSLDPSEPTTIVNGFFKERHAQSTMRGTLRRTFFRTISAEPGRVQVHRSKVSYNNAYPAVFRNLLADAKLVWPDYGIRADVPLPEKVDMQAMIDRHLVQVAKLANEWQHFDIVLGYQPLLDTMGHRYQAQLGDDLRPINEQVQAYRQAYKIVDQNLSDLFSLSAGDSTIALMGDHGMDTILFGVNVAKFIPKALFDQVSVVTSGSMVLLYPRDPSNKDHVTAAQAAGAEIAAQLKSLRARPPGAADSVASRPVLDEARRKSDQRWQYGQAEWAFLSELGVELAYSPFNEDLILRPGISGTHGRDPRHPDMVTAFLYYTPGLTPRLLEPMSLMSAIPTFAAGLGLEKPRDCRGEALSLNRSAQP